jgi:glycosyltransferase involved in cell wall biosynthesis
MGMSVKTQRTVVMAHPSADVHDAGLQLLETVAALCDRGWRVVVVLPSTGPLVPRLTALGAEVELLPFPVLRRADLSVRGVASLVWSSAAALVRMRRFLVHLRPELVYVNTITLPWLLVVARLCRLPSVCHVHEAEVQDRAWVRRALAVPLGLAGATLVNSSTTFAITAEAAPYIRRRLRLIRNGARGPSTPRPTARQPESPYRLLVVGRISPRKAPDVALEATALLRKAGRDVVLELCGTPGPGHEAYFSELRARADRPDLAGAVTFTGYRAPIWPALDRADALVAPSLGESFGNAVVGGQLARRPVVATAVQGHLETVADGVSGLLVPVRDPAATAAAIARLMDRPGTARRMAFLGMRRAEERFEIPRYAEEIVSVAAELVGAPAPTRAGHWPRVAQA